MSAENIGDSIENLSRESRQFPPSAQFAAQANAKADLYAHADKDRLAFWEEQARELTWDKPWDRVLEWNCPYAKWFIGGKLNASYNCVGCLGTVSPAALKITPELLAVSFP